MISESAPGPRTPCPAPFNMAAHVLTHADHLADKTAMEVLGRAAHRISYGALKSAVLGVATGLTRAGLAPGDRILLRLGNTEDFPIAYLGTIAAGMVPVPSSTQLTLTELAHATALIAPAAILHAPGVTCPDAICPILSLDDLRAMYALPPAAWHMGDPDRPGYIVFTSGTSGTARAVVHAHRAIWARRMMHDGWEGLTQSDRLLHAGAFNWTYTLGAGLMDPWSVGATALIPAEGTPIEALPDLLNTHNATIFAAAPGVYRRMLKSSTPLNLPTLRHGLSAGEKLSPDLRAAFLSATGRSIHEAFGMSEISTFLSGSPSHPSHATTLGRAQPGRHIAILPANDGPDATVPVPLNTAGVIAVRRDDPGLMLGYLNAEAATQARCRGDWFLTGDLGTMAADGQITYLGRDDDMMNAGGYRVSPVEVESTLSALPGLTSVACATVEVRPGVQVIAAFYTGPAALDDTSLRAFAAKHLAHYKTPRIYVHLDQLPTGGNGKVLRKALAPLYTPAPEGDARPHSPGQITADPA
ncbi:class I adenylate-forming enzyme family protein [Rhodobacteraceae bacterium KMM 6894]|nr:class I adenylate-forming enzyme family protein [Rhodobacteraceae bacterium KMM 6894]